MGKMVEVEVELTYMMFKFCVVFKIYQETSATILHSFYVIILTYVNYSLQVLFTEVYTYKTMLSR